MLAVKGLSMEKWLCWGSLGVAGLLLVLFLLDLILDIAGLGWRPFGGISYFVDVVCILIAGAVVYLSYDALQDLK